jgi:hypothetical protein
MIAVSPSVRYRAANLDQTDVFTKRGNTMKFISNERMKSENLDWGELIEPNEHSDFWHHEIVDRCGEVHIGVVYEDGAVETVYSVWDSVDTFERFQARPVLQSLQWTCDRNAPLESGCR